MGDREAAEGGRRGLEGSRGPSGPSAGAVHAHAPCSGSSSSWCRAIVVRPAAGRCRARGGAGPEPGPRGGRLRLGAVRPVAARELHAEPRESRRRCRHSVVVVTLRVVVVVVVVAAAAAFLYSH